MLNLSDIKIGSKSGNDSKEKISSKDIAIIGIAVKLSMAETVEELWSNFKNGIDCIRELPSKRKQDIESYLDYRKEKESKRTYKEAAFIEEIDNFDYEFFKLSPKEASLMDPNQRQFLETVWKAIEDAGYGGKRIQSTNTGVFLGCGADCVYRDMVEKVEPASSSIAAVGNLRPVIASRISYLLDLKGPTMLIDTACSSSMVAVHLACQSLRNKECDMAIAGGIQIHVIPVSQADIGTTSSDGRTKTFDIDADGTGTGEGVITIMLKPLSSAVRDKDNIYAVIKGSAINSDGSSLGLTAPNSSAQERVILKAWEDAGIDPTTISYVEAHGTGTKLGDPIEVEGLTRAFKRFTDKRAFCAISAAKTNYGHLDSASGILGVVKAALALKYKMIPRTLNFRCPNAEIDFTDSPVYVAQKTMEWKLSGDKRRCGVNSFGISGTNAHIVLEEAPAAPVEKLMTGDRLDVFTISARSEEQVNQLVCDYLTYLKDRKEAFHDICYTAATGREQFQHRISIVAVNLDELKEKLELCRDKKSEGLAELGIFVGTHFVLDKGQKNSKDSEYTEQEIAAYSKEAALKIKEFISQDRNNAELLMEIGKLFTKGAVIDWDMFYEGESRRRVSIPSYPFAKNRCWLDIPCVNGEQVDVSELLYETSWKLAEKCVKAEKIEKDGVMLVLGEHDTYYDSIVERLVASGVKLLQIYAGTEYSKMGEHAYTYVNSQAGYETLLEGLASEKITRVLYIPSFEEEKEAESIAQVEENLESGVYSVFRLAKALTTRYAGQKLEFIFLSRSIQNVTGEETCMYPEDAAVHGVAMSLPVEYPSFASRFIEVDSQTAAQTVVNEITSKKQYFKIAYRKGIRYREELQRIQKKEVKNPVLGIRDQGTYIITGGLGDIGTKLAFHLAKSSSANLVLIGRSKLPEAERWTELLNQEEGKEHKKIKIMQELTAIRPNISYYAADIAVESQVADVFEKVRTQYGAINGIIHCAGIGANMEGKRIGEEEEDIFQKVLLPKVQGTWILNQQAKNDELDFFLMFSSAITLIGGRGSSHYTAANCYMDAFSMHNKGKTRYLALDWAPWDREDAISDKKTFEEKHIFKILPREISLKAFDEALCMEQNRIVVGELNTKAEIFKIQELLPFTLSKELKDEIAKTQEDNVPVQVKKQTKALTLTGNENGDYSTVEKKIARIWGDMLGYEKLSVYDNFFEMGGDSILAAKIHEQMQQEFTKTFSVADIFAYPTIAKMAEYISGDEGSEEQDSTIVDAKEEKDAKEDIMDLFERVSNGEMSMDNALERLNSMED